MNIYLGDKVKVFGQEWLVAGVARTYLYLTRPDMPTWAPQRFVQGSVTHVLRDGQWLAIEAPDAERDFVVSSADKL